MKLKRKKVVESLFRFNCYFEINLKAKNSDKKIKHIQTRLKQYNYYINLFTKKGYWNIKTSDSWDDVFYGTRWETDSELNKRQIKHDQDQKSLQEYHKKEKERQKRLQVKEKVQRIKDEQLLLKVLSNKYKLKII